MAWTVILRNNSGSTVEIVDLGIELQNTEVRTLSDTFSNTQLLGSADLKLLVTAGTLVVNNGVDDLTSVQGTNYVFPENIYHTGKTYALQGDFSDHGSLTGRNNPSQHEIASITGLTVALTDVEYTTNKGTSGGYATLDGSGLILYEELPQIAITSTYVVASSAEQVALDAQEGDVAVRTDENKSYIHDGGIAGDMTDWQELLTPTDTVLSVNGYVGAVTLAASDIGSTAGNVQTDVDALSAAISPSQDHTVLLDSGGNVVANASTGNLELEPTSHIRLYGDNNSGISLYVDDSNGLGDGTAGIHSIASSGYSNIRLDRQANGNTMYLRDTGSTSSDTIYAQHTTTVKSGNFIEARMANGSGSFSGNFFNFYNNSLEVFRVDSTGAITSTTVDELSAAIVHNYTEHVSLSGAIDGNTLSYFVEAQNTAAPNDIIPVNSWTAIGAQTDIDLALTPKGTGAITAQVADNTTTGGQKRGTNAVDLQMSRTSGLQVATGAYSTIGGGSRNDAGGEGSTVGGGDLNSADGTWAVVCGGQKNSAIGDMSVVCGGGRDIIGWQNVAGGNWSFIGCGYDNDAYGAQSVVVGGNDNAIAAAGSNATIGGGFGNKIFSSYTTIAGGVSNNINLNGQASTICGGAFNSAEQTYCFIGGGYNNIASGSYSVVCGGGFSTVGTGNEATAPNSAIVGGKNNTTAGDYSIIGGGLDNLITGGRSYGFIGGGQSNNINLGTNGTICGGLSNTTGHRGFVGGGYDNIASGGGSTILGGSSNTASGAFSSVPGGYLNTASGDNSFAFGQSAVSDQLGQFAFSSGNISNPGDAQGSKFILRGSTIDATPKVLTTNESTAGTTNQIAVKDGQAISFIGTVTAKQGSLTNLASWKVEGVIVREGTTTTLIANTKTVISNVPGWGLSITADDTNEALQFTFTGALATNIRIVAAIDTSEVVY